MPDRRPSPGFPPGGTPLGGFPSGGLHPGGPLLITLSLCLCLSCEEEPRSEPHIAGQLVGKAPGEGKEKRPPVRRARAEERRSSWREELAIALPALPDAEACPDADQDGFPSALFCPGGTPGAAPGSEFEDLDCDDTDPGVTPATERVVPAGPFLMGSVSSMASADEGPVAVVQLGLWCLDVTEVRARDFQAWLADRKPTGPGTRRPSADGSLPAELKRRPAEGVTWQEAQGYCAALGKVLPTEAAWEKAARGGCERGADPSHCDAADFRPYSWGPAGPSCEAANHRLVEGGTALLCAEDTVDVDDDRLGTGPYGHLHLLGNVWEYVADWYGPNTYIAEGRVDPTGPTSGEVHILRGGAWNSPSQSLRVAHRAPDLVPNRATGFRCARSFSEGKSDKPSSIALLILSGTIESPPQTHGTLQLAVFDPAEAPSGEGAAAEARSGEMQGEPLSVVVIPAAKKGLTAFTIRVPGSGPYELRLTGPAGQQGRALVPSGTDPAGIHLVLDAAPP